MQKSSEMITIPENSLLLDRMQWNKIIKYQNQHSADPVSRSDLRKSDKIFDKQLQSYFASKRKLSNRKQEKNGNVKKTSPSRERKQLKSINFRY